MSSQTSGQAYNLSSRIGDSILIGDPATPVFSPKATLHRWNGECWLKFSFDDSEIAVDQKTVQLTADNKVQWATPLFDFKFYGDGRDDGGLEFEIVLKARPSQNTFSFPVQAEGLCFFYQPPLNRELNPVDYFELSETYARHKNGGERWRPENVVGSYAVYHASRKNNGYKTGKAFHIYRPKLTDAEGKTAWGEFNPDLEDTRVLTVTLPREFLDNAAYPVVVDPTFGYTSVGGSSGSAGGSETIWGSKFTMPESGSITSVTAYVSAYSGTQGSKAFVYSDVSGAVTNKLATSSSDISLGGSLAWQQYTVSYSGVNTAYWLCFSCNDGGKFQYDSGGTNQLFASGIADYTNPPSPIASPTYYNLKMSIYATYTTGGTLQTVTDTLSLSDAVLRHKPLLPIADSLGLADALLRGKTFAVSDVAGLADAVLRNKTFTVTDAIALAETIKALKTLTITDQIQLAELLDVLKGGILKSVTDAIGLTDSALANKILALADSITLLDAALTPARVLHALDAVGVADGAWVSKVLQVSDAVSVAEVVVVGAGGVKQTRLFLVLGDLAVQLTGD